MSPDQDRASSSSGNSITVTVLYEAPFWVGIFERHDERGYSVGRTVFGNEPTNPELYHFLLYQSDSIRYSTPSREETVEAVHVHKNPKRQLREVRKTLSKQPAISKAQDALRIELEKNKKVRKKVSTEEKRLREQQQFDLKQEKRKNKHKGH